MKLLQTLSIVVLFVTGLNICLASTSSSSSTAASTTAANSSSTNTTTSTNATTATSTATPTSTATLTTQLTTTMSQTTTPMNHTCYNSTCSFEGCLKNVNSTCFGMACKFHTEQSSNGTVNMVTASCDNNCKDINCANASSTTRTCCCHADKCNNDYPTKAPSPACVASISPTLFLMMSIFLFIVVKKEF